MTQDDHWIIKYSSTGSTIDQIARKMGMSREQVEERLNIIRKELEVIQNSGSGTVDLGNQFHTLCEEYRLLGESLKLVGAGVGNDASLEEVIAVVRQSTDPVQVALLLKQHFIVLRPYVYVDPLESVKIQEQKTISGN